MKLFLITPAFVLLLLAGCNRGTQTPDAVRQGVVDYLSKRSDISMASMQIDVTSVSFRQNEADATVAFRPKGSPSGGMQMRYTLERQGNRWVVKGRGQTPGGASPHSGNMMPGGAPSGSLPPNHPPMGGAKPSDSPTK